MDWYKNKKNDKKWKKKGEGNTLGSSSGSSEPVLPLGTKLEILSQTGNWRQCSLVQKSSTSLKIHYDGFDSEYDEWINMDTDGHRVREAQAVVDMIQRSGTPSDATEAAKAAALARLGSGSSGARQRTVADQQAAEARLAAIEARAGTVSAPPRVPFCGCADKPSLTEHTVRSAKVGWAAKDCSRSTRW
jgi:hypothetical protein